MYIRVSLLSLLLAACCSQATLKVELKLRAEENGLVYHEVKPPLLVQENVPTNITVGDFTIVAQFHGEGEAMINSYFMVRHHNKIVGEPSSFTTHYGRESRIEVRDNQMRTKGADKLQVAWKVHKLGN